MEVRVVRGIGRKEGCHQRGWAFEGVEEHRKCEIRTGGCGGVEPLSRVTGDR